MANEYKNCWKSGRHVCRLSVFAVLVIAVLILFAACATHTKIEYRDRDVNHYITNTVHDTLIDKSTDSVYFEVKVKGDTVFATKYKEKTRWRDRIIERHDTCFRDSIVTITKETVVEVKKNPKIYSISLWFSIICIIFAMIKLMQWLRMR